MGSSGYDYQSLAMAWWKAAWPTLGRVLAFIILVAFWATTALIFGGIKPAILVLGLVGVVLLLSCIAATVNYLIRRANMG